MRRYLIFKYLYIIAFPVMFLFLGGSLLSQAAMPRTSLYIQNKKNEWIKMQIEIAATPEQRARGLMHRKYLRANHGMLFVFPQEQQVGFWMKNTLIPLSIAYISAQGKILEIHTLNPQSQKVVRSQNKVRYALEVNKGFFRANQIKPGCNIRFSID